ncbi:hypothetical protein SPF06_07060 [Sinomonas sp. JGH33]|uniref:Uncharacterized protein n=1 Tax=Sinomonas terricola TaxID=3110330 RepID=A0ABU5T5Q5_9MICC|nr:hypothetical protein [Sinomonas sp. JGH33]MEA5454476.1 hypothetical protein [Sinomonas sp. JGH33]
MASVDLGATTVLEWDSMPSGDAPSLSIVQPDGTSVAALAAPTGPTTATAPFTPTMPGRHLARWTAFTMDGTTGAHVDVLDVWPLDPLFIIPAQEMVNGLNAHHATPDQLEDMRLFVAAATPVIEDIVGPVVHREFTQKFDGGMYAVVLKYKADAVVGVTELGTALADFVFDDEASIVYAGRQLAPRLFMPGVAAVVVTFTAGYTVIPANIRLATRELVRHWWQIGMQMAGGSVRGQASSDDVFTPSGFAVPRRVMELCTPHEGHGGFA